MFFTYQPVVNGNRLTYYAITVFSQLLFIWIGLQAQSSKRIVILLGSILTLFLLQIWKLSHPILTGNQSLITTSFNTDSNWSRQWVPVTQGRGDIIQEASTVALIRTKDSAPSLRLHTMPILPAEMYWSSLMRPLLQSQRIHEQRTVTVVCSITRVLPYLLFFSSNKFTIQYIANGVLITSSLPSKNVSADFIPVSQDISEQFHTWKIIADGSMLYIFLNEARIWSNIQIDIFDRYIIGEQSLDPEHGGAIYVKEISVSRTTLLS